MNALSNRVEKLEHDAAERDGLCQACGKFRLVSLADMSKLIDGETVATPGIADDVGICAHTELGRFLEAVAQFGVDGAVAQLDGGAA